MRAAEWSCSRIRKKQIEGFSWLQTEFPAFSRAFSVHSTSEIPRTPEKFVKLTKSSAEDKLFLKDTYYSFSFGSNSFSLTEAEFGND
jgi:hypothetical protein